MDELFARHRKEQRELQNRITSKKKNATKKTRKGARGGRKGTPNNHYGKAASLRSTACYVSEDAWRRLLPLLKDTGRVEYTAITDEEALDAFQLLCRTEGIIPALEPAHAIAAVAKRAKDMPKESIILANLCGRGDKDIFTVAEKLGVEI